MRNLLNEFSDTFAKNAKKPQTMDIIEHHILTGDSQPVYMKPRCIPIAWENDVNVQIDEMMKNGIMRPSNSPWNAY